jgi:hypothetical protein
LKAKKTDIGNTNALVWVQRETFRIIFQLVVLFADNWTTTSAEIIKESARKTQALIKGTGYRFKQKKPKSD